MLRIHTREISHWRCVTVGHRRVLCWKMRGNAVSYHQKLECDKILFFFSIYSLSTKYLNKIQRLENCETPNLMNIKLNAQKIFWIFLYFFLCLLGKMYENVRSSFSDFMWTSRTCNCRTRRRVCILWTAIGKNRKKQSLKFWAKFRRKFCMLNWKKNLNIWTKDWIKTW